MRVKAGREVACMREILLDMPVVFDEERKI